MSALEPERRPRADAQRNRARLVDLARAAFRSGETNITFDELAKRAGVGIGTLYRHFPTREGLIEAVYRAQIDELSAAAETFAVTKSPIEALRAWMLLFVDYIAGKQLIAPALNGTIDGGTEVTARSGKVIKQAIRELASRAVAVGEFDATIDAIDLLRALVGVANVSSSPDWEASARRLVDILIAGSRPSAENGP